MQQRARWAVRSLVQAHPDATQRCQRCGRVRIRREIDVLTSCGSAWYDGIAKCRTRLCPVCWIARRAQLAHEITHVVASRSAQTRQRPMLATLTIRHGASDPVSICRAVRKCWSMMISGRAWTKRRDAAGIEWIAAEEITLGKNGWHPHMHVLLLPRAALGDLSALNDWWFERWYGIVLRAFGDDPAAPIEETHLPSLEHGADLRPCDAAGYLSKLGLELTDSGVVKGRSPLLLLQAGEIESYMKLQLSRHRARDVTWSGGLRALRKRVPDPGDPELQLQLRGSEWGRLAAQGDGALLDVLQASAAGEGRAVAEWWLGPLRGA